MLSSLTFAGGFRYLDGFGPFLTTLLGFWRPGKDAVVPGKAVLPIVRVAVL